MVKRGRGIPRRQGIPDQPGIEMCSATAVLWWHTAAELKDATAKRREGERRTGGAVWVIGKGEPIFVKGQPGRRFWANSKPIIVSLIF